MTTRPSDRAIAESFYEFNDMSYDMDFFMDVRTQVIKRAREIDAKPVELPPIERDETMNRDYIPLPGGWEIQTKGSGSTFRIAGPLGKNREMDQWPITDPYLPEILTQMANDIRDAWNRREGRGK